MENRFTFPRVRKELLEELTLTEQAKKIQEEAAEVEGSLYKDFAGKPIPTWLEDMAEQAYDTIHAAEVLLQILEQRNVDIQSVRRKVEEKNRAKWRS